MFLLFFLFKSQINLFDSQYKQPITQAQEIKERKF